MDLTTPIAAVAAAHRPGPAPTWNVIPPHEEAGAAADRAAEWNSSLRPFTAFDVFLVDQIAVNSVRMERCQNHERTTRTRNARRAALRWQVDRELAAEELGAKLPKSPTRVARKLRATKQGCQWLLSRWEGLGGILDAAGDWDEAQRSLALDLLGTPREFRAGPGPLPGDLDGRRALILAEVGALRDAIRDSLAELDASEREAAEMGFGADHDGELASIRRFERTCTRRLEWAREQLRPGRRVGRVGGEASPLPPQPPATAPAASPAVAPRPPIEEQWRESMRAAESRKRALAALEAAEGPPDGASLSRSPPRARPRHRPCRLPWHVLSPPPRRRSVP